MRGAPGNKIEPPESATASALMRDRQRNLVVFSCLSPFWGLVTAGRLETIREMIRVV